MEKHSVDFQLLTKSLNSSKKFPLIGCIRKSPYSKTIHFAPRHDWRGDSAHWCSLPCDWCPALNPFFKIRKALVFRNPSKSWPEHSLIVTFSVRNLISLLEGTSCTKNGDVVSYLIGHLISFFACASRCQSKLQNFQTNRIIMGLSGMEPEGRSET